MLQRYLLVWLLVLSSIAWIWPAISAAVDEGRRDADRGDVRQPFDPFLITSPETGTPAPRFSIGVLVSIAMFSIGLLLPHDEVVQVVHRWPTVLGGTLVQYTAMPLLAVVLAMLFRLPRDLFVGVVLVGCVPGAMASNVLTMVARGNVSYSVSLTTLATLVSPIVVPLALRSALRTEASIDALGVSSQLLREVVGPVVAGHVVSRQGGGVAAAMRRLAGPVANLAILWIIATVVALNRDRLQQTPMSVLAALLILNLAGYLAGYGGSALLRLPVGMRRALTLEVGMQNAGVGTALALKWFDDAPTAAIPSAVYTFGCMLTGTLLAHWFASRPTDQTTATPRAADDRIQISGNEPGDSGA